jgi:predicted nucleic acid-binding protein
MLVLDNSVAMAWCFDDESSPYAERALDAVVRDTAIVPAVWPLEVANGLRSGVRRQRISPDRARSLAVELRALRVQVEPADLDRDLGAVLDLALANGLTSYDAAYLELALRTALPLATQDEALRGAASRLGVSLFA